MNEYKSYMLNNFRTIPQLKNFSPEDLSDIETVGTVLPFKTNNYVVDELIDWSKVPDDPIFKLTFPQKEMLLPEDFDLISAVKNAEADILKDAVSSIRRKLNPHPAGQVKNIPVLHGERLEGLQHKYRETVLFFPSHGQTCHAYCTFCFRWPQFTGADSMKFASRQTEKLVSYLELHPEVTDVLFTGGDPMVMKTKLLKEYILPLLSDRLPNIQTIRIGTKSLSYWPYRFLTDNDSDELISLFDKIVKSGKNLAIMSHFNHPVELSTEAVRKAIARIRSTGAQIRGQSPLLRHINDSPEVWAENWRMQVNLNCIPYYMFIARDTGARHYFEVPLVDAWRIFREAYQKVSGVCRTVRGPSMSCTPGKVQLLGTAEIFGKKVFTLRMIQGRNPDWVARPFFARYDEKATWFDELKPAFGEDEFFFEKEPLQTRDFGGTFSFSEN
ncbi:MAG TPA: lysine 2,3-aminomutase [Ignavibacteriales bacterium]|nr:lysine 2,3-aminomutase [Ignavibacteriales bacterium]